MQLFLCKIALLSFLVSQDVSAVIRTIRRTEQVDADGAVQPGNGATIDDSDSMVSLSVSARGTVGDAYDSEEGTVADAKASEERHEKVVLRRVSLH